MIKSGIFSIGDTVCAPEAVEALLTYMQEQYGGLSAQMANTYEGMMGNLEDAKANAARNGVTNAEFLCADAAQAAQTLADRGLRPDVICVDPPRKGLAPAVIDAIVQMAPQRLVYVSCDPATLARDVKRMEEQGYVLQRAEAVDLFPRTAHVETVCLLSKLKY